MSVSEAEVSSDSSCRLGLKPLRLKAAALKLVYIPKKGITEYLYSLKVDYRVAQLCIYQKSGLQSTATLYIPKKGITEWLYSVYTKKVDYRVAQLCIYQKSELQSRTTLYIPKK